MTLKTVVNVLHKVHLVAVLDLSVDQKSLN